MKHMDSEVMMTQFLDRDFRNWEIVRATSPTSSKISAISDVAGVMSSKEGYRRILLIKTEDGCFQAFYLSSGRNSGMPEIWLPFNGMLGFWFDKTGYTEFLPDELVRFGTPVLKEISQILKQEVDLDCLPSVLFESNDLQANRVNNWFRKQKKLLEQDKS